LLALLVSVALLSGRRILTLPPPSLRIQLLLEIWGLMCVGGGGGGVCVPARYQGIHLIFALIYVD